MPTLAELLGSAAVSAQSNPFSPGISPASDLWWLQRAIEPPWLPTSPPAFSTFSPQANTPSQNAASSGGLLGPVFGDAGSANSTPAGGILQNLVPDRPQSMVRIPSTSGLFGPLHPESSPANPFTYGTSFPLSNPGWQTTSGATQDIARISNPSSPAWFDEQPTSTNVALRPWPDQRVFQRLSAPQVTAAAPAPTAPPAANATDAHASAATLNGKPPDPDYDRRYAQIIASDPDLSTAVRMAENAGDKTFKDWLTTVLRNLEHNPAAAFEAIRQAAFTNQMCAQTRGTGADVIANLAARKAADRLEALNPGLAGC